MSGTIRPSSPPEPARLDAPLLCPDDAVALLAVKTSCIHDAVQAGRMPCLRVGRHIRFTRVMLEARLAELWHQA